MAAPMSEAVNRSWPRAAPLSEVVGCVATASARQLMVLLRPSAWPPRLEDPNAKCWMTAGRLAACQLLLQLLLHC